MSASIAAALLLDAVAVVLLTSIVFFIVLEMASNEGFASVAPSRVSDARAVFRPSDALDRAPSSEASGLVGEVKVKRRKNPPSKKMTKTAKQSLLLR